MIIPEGVTEIEVGAFYDCRSMNGELSLPSTLKYIGRGIENGGMEEFSLTVDLIVN